MSAQNFVAWVLEDLDGISAEKGGPRDIELREYVSEGFLELAVETEHDCFYTFTAKGLDALRGIGGAP